MSQPPDDKPTHCLLGHRMFAMFQEPMFRRADADATSVMVVRLGEREAAMPLRSIQREFGIPDDSADGQMLALISEALDFVPLLRIGDPLPSEVLTGAASWEPSPDHLRVAFARLQLQLVAWLRGDTGTDPVVFDAQALARADEDPGLRQQIQEAFQRAAEALGLPSKDAVIEQLETLAFELAFIEALRERLLDRVRAMAGWIARAAWAGRSEVGQRGALERVRYLSTEALRQLGHRFEEQDAQAGEVMAVLRHIDSHRGFIRSNRDWLYRSHMAWEPVLAEWDKIGAASEEDRRALLARTYQFLAPRYMPVTEWLKGNKPAKKAEIGARMAW